MYATSGAVKKTNETVVRPAHRIARMATRSAAAAADLNGS
jgi:hypothetical protein